MTSVEGGSLGSYRLTPKPSVPRRIIRLVDKAVDKALTVLFLIVLAIGIYFAYDSYYVFTGSTLGNISGYKPPEEGGVEVLRELSEDTVAWITIDGTTIDYPVMQGVDNTEYLNKNAYGDYSLSGAIFLDSGNAPDFSDDYSVLYGHHMAGGFMFGALDSFIDGAYLRSHSSGTLTVSDGRRYAITLFASMEADASDRAVFDIHSGEDVRAFIRENSRVYEAEKGSLSSELLYGSRILALTTCKSPLTTERLLVFGILTEK